MSVDIGNGEWGVQLDGTEVTDATKALLGSGSEIVLTNVSALMLSKTTDPRMVDVLEFTFSVRGVESVTITYTQENKTSNHVVS